MTNLNKECQVICLHTYRETKRVEPPATLKMVGESDLGKRYRVDIRKFLSSLSSYALDETILNNCDSIPQPKEASCSRNAKNPVSKRLDSSRDLCYDVGRLRDHKTSNQKIFRHLVGVVRNY